MRYRLRRLHLSGSLFEVRFARPPLCGGSVAQASPKGTSRPRNVPSHGDELSAKLTEGVLPSSTYPQKKYAACRKKAFWCRLRFPTALESEAERERFTELCERYRGPMEKAPSFPRNVIKLKLMGRYYGAYAPSFCCRRTCPSSVTFGDSFPQGKPKARIAMLSSRPAAATAFPLGEGGPRSGG